ncbi:MAG: hypothetical protein M3R20_04195, partial [Pseudomonadota bacterium]|nr:hypothetical protein [Pseudomonadota bacterium]
VDLRAIGPESLMAPLRKDLAQASIEAIKAYTFNMPKSGQEMDADHRTIRIPVDYEIANGSVPPKHEYGQWDAYVPGPIEPIVWLRQDEQVTNGSADAIPNGLAFQGDQRFVLLNPPGNG